MSNKKRQAKLNAIRDSCRAYITGPLHARLSEQVADATRGMGRVEIDEADRDGQTLMIWYPAVEAKPADYIKPAVRIESGGQHALFIGEMMPTTAHRHLPWIMAYDLFPLETLEMKRKLFAECVANNSLVLLNHDPTAFAVRMRNPSGDKLEIEKVF